MERIESCSFVRLRPVVVHRLVLDEIVRRAGTLGTPVVLSAGDYKVESLDEAMKEFGSRLKDLEIAGGRGSVLRIQFTPRATNLFGHTPEAKALVLDLAEQLRTRQRAGTPAWLSPLARRMRDRGSDLQRCGS